MLVGNSHKLINISVLRIIFALWGSETRKFQYSQVSTFDMVVKLVSIFSSVSSDQEVDD